MDIWVNGCNLSETSYQDVIDTFPEGNSILWVERNDFLINLDTDRLVPNSDPVLNTQMAILQEAELERIDEDELYFSRRGPGSLG